jgi:DNA (cytosine-5)-methyltransferase 1
MEKMRHGSLFSGIGGFDLAAEWMGWENVFHCEWNDFGKKVLNYYWPKAIQYHDITKTDFTIHRGRIDILTGGFPCQPFSSAGKRKGTADDRHLWPEMLRAIREIKPTWIVGENVSGIISWDGGLVFQQVQIDLEAEGYEVQAVVLPACGVGAPHRRDRVWFVAYCDNARANNRSGINRNGQKENEGWKEQSQPEHWQNGSNEIATYPNSNGHELRRFGKDRQSQGESVSQQEERERIRSNDRGVSEQRSIADTEPTGLEGENKSRSKERGFWEYIRGNTTGHNTSDAADTSYKGLQGSEINGVAGSCWKESHKHPTGFIRCGWEVFPTQSPICSRNDGVSTKLSGITFPKWRNESIKAAGNAIVPQVVYQIFKVIGEWKQ